jgi:ABC-type nitrate/sulfonate/bicarbonate transport system substrate-binding protein
MSAAIMTVALTAGSSAMAQTRTLEVLVFAGASALPIYVAQDKGFFAKEGLTVNVTATPSSGFQMSNLINGKFHIAGTAADNLIAYQEGQGTSAVEGPVDLIMVMGGSSTELALMAQPSIKSIGELKGKQFALDSLSTGYAFVLRKMLEKNGLQPSDYEFVAVGGTRERLESLKDGKMSAALVSEPFTTQAKNAGYTFLGEAVSAVGPYLASVQITNRAWAQQNEAAMVGYIRGLVNAVDWLYDASNTDEAVKILAAKVNTSEAVARPSTIGATKGQAALAPKGAQGRASTRGAKPCYRFLT